MKSAIILPIIHKSKTLFNLDFEYLDQKISELFIYNSSNLSKAKQKQVKAVCLLLNCFLGIQKKKLSLLNFLNKKDTNKIISEFIWFLDNNGFNIAKAGCVTYRSIFLSIIEQINLTKNTAFLIDSSVKFDCTKICKEQIRYFNGWWLKVDGENYEMSISLHQCFNKFGYSDTEALFEKINHFSIAEPSLFMQSVHVLTKFLNFLPNNTNSAFEWNKELLLKSFMRDFFINKDKNGNDLHNGKKQWNCFNKLAQLIFDLPNDLLILIDVKGKKSFEHNIKHTLHGQTKVKLITEIPLEICDDKALTMLIQKINQEVDLVKDWANHTINSFLELTKDKSKLLQSDSYGKGKIEISKKHRNKVGVPLTEIFDRNTIFQRRHALAIAYLLISEHPEITESFLLNCTVTESIKETDQGTYLVSYKNRKGPDLSEQKILLNNNSLKLINILLDETKIIRNFLQANNNPDYEKLFICCNSADLFPSAPKVLNEREGINRDTNKSIINFLIEKRDFDEESAINFANKITLTKMRASRGVQVYLTTESTTKMAQALGHTRHRPELLAHYLPEPITDFFQRRWISIFQKGIICEALKDSNFLLKATGFTSMSQLDEFLKNHTLRKIPDNSDEILKKNEKISIETTTNSEIYISIDEQKLSALLSLHTAVNDAEHKNKIAPNAYYWSLFAERLTREITENKSYTSFRGILNTAKENINKELFKEIIYVE
jgi:hypothetical protein